MLVFSWSFFFFFFKLAFRAINLVQKYEAYVKSFEKWTRFLSWLAAVTQLYSHIHRARSILSPCWDGAVYVHVCVYLPLPACLPACSLACLPACWSGLAQSVIQVRPTGSGLMRIGSALSGSGPGVEAVCGAQGEKRNAVEHTSSPSLETARDAAKHSENSDLSRHNDTAQCSGFLWGAVGQGFLKTHKPQKESKH